MTQQYDNTNRGILSKNTRRENETHAEYTGAINIEGTEYWLNAWVKERKDGSGKYFSLSVKPKGPTAKPPRSHLARTVDAQQDEDIPF